MRSPYSRISKIKTNFSVKAPGSLKVEPMLGALSFSFIDKSDNERVFEVKQESSTPGTAGTVIKRISGEITSRRTGDKISFSLASQPVGTVVKFFVQARNGSEISNKSNVLRFTFK